MCPYTQIPEIQHIYVIISKTKKQRVQKAKTYKEVVVYVDSSVQNGLVEIRTYLHNLQS